MSGAWVASTSVPAKTTGMTLAMAVAMARRPWEETMLMLVAVDGVIKGLVNRVQVVSWFGRVCGQVTHTRLAGTQTYEIQGEHSDSI
jgi:hypothetical protein